MSINWDRDNNIRPISQNEHFDFVITTLVQLFKS